MHTPTARRLRRRARLICALSGLLAPAAAAQGCPDTPFACAVDVAIDAGLAHLRREERGTGVFLDNPAASFLGILAFLERPAGVGWRGAPLGYAGLPAADQDLVRRVVATLIDGERGLSQPGGLPYVYVTGGGVAVLTRYLSTGGPDDVGARVKVSEAVALGVAALQAVQGNIEPFNTGGWNYQAPAPAGDLSVVPFAVAGLTAGAALVDGADATLPDVLPFLAASQARHGGAGYHPGEVASSSMTAAHLWCSRLLGVPASAPGPQAALGWLRAHYAVDRMVGAVLSPDAKRPALRNPDPMLYLPESV